MEEPQLRHLDQIQGIVNRLASNSFSYKAWCISIISALLTFNFLSGSKLLVFLAIIVSVTFWGLDGYYLSEERRFRAIYDVIRRQTPEVWSEDQFSMNPKGYSEEKCGWIKAVFSKTIVGLYCPIIIALLLIAEYQILVTDINTMCCK